MFERAYRGPFRDFDESMLRRASLGGQIELVRRKLTSIAFSRGVDAAADTYEKRFRRPLNDYVREQAAALQGPMMPYSSPRQDPQLYAELTDQLALLPVMFEFPSESARAHRHRLISTQGIYGIVANVLSQELQKTPDSEAEKGRWIGAINDLTANAILNRPQLNDAVALTALPEEDEGLKIDLHYYMIINGIARRRDRQVKTAMPLPDQIDIRTPRIISANMLGNDSHSRYWQYKHPFQTARAIIAETANTADQSQIAVLDVITNDLLASLGQQAIFSRELTDLAA